MKHLFYTDIRIPGGQSGSRRCRRCAEAERLCADPAAWPVTRGGSIAPGGPGSLRGPLC